MCFAGSSIVIKGSTTVLPIAQGTLEAFMKKNLKYRFLFPVVVPVKY